MVTSAGKTPSSPLWAAHQEVCPAHPWGTCWPREPHDGPALGSGRGRTERLGPSRRGLEVPVQKEARSESQHLSIPDGPHALPQASLLVAEALTTGQREGSGLADERRDRPPRVRISSSSCRGLPTDVDTRGPGLLHWPARPSRPQEPPDTGQGVGAATHRASQGLRADGERSPGRTHRNRAAQPRRVVQAPAQLQMREGAGPAGSPAATGGGPFRTPHNRCVSESPRRRMAASSRTVEEGSAWAPESSRQAGLDRGLCQTSPGVLCRGRGAGGVLP